MSRTERTCSAVLVALALAFFSSSTAWAQNAPAAAPAVEYEAPEYPPPSTRWKVVTAGLGTTATFYGAAVAASYIFPESVTPGTSQLRIPVVGPWLAIGKGGCAPGDDCSTVLAVMRIILTSIDGAAQAGGLAVAVEGIFMPTQEVAPGAPRAPSPAPSPGPSTPSPNPSPSPSNGDKNLFWIPTPMAVGSAGVGIGVVGRF
jgi:hypothetical protein